jgi:hypothetical protein
MGPQNFVSRSLVGLLPLVLSCASSGTEPHAMTAAQHQAAARSEAKAAAAHQSQYDPARESAAPTPETGIRWASSENPTDPHRREAEKHRKLAEKHRAASKALVDAEQRFCFGIAEADRDLSPFYHREDVTAVQGLVSTPAQAYGFPGGGISVVEIQQIEKEVLGPGGLRGARVTFRAVPGMTGEWLQRVVHCHLARNAVVGNDPSMSFCPLAVPHATAVVTSTGSGFAVDVTSDDADSVREIVKRASALGPK